LRDTPSHLHDTSQFTSVAEGVERIRSLAGSLAAGRRVRIMELCGTHTMAVARCGLRGLLPANLQLVSGPGCPVCVTESSYIDRAIFLSRQPGVIVATFGDMVRVPGLHGSLSRARADGAEVEVVYSPLQAAELASRRPDKQIVFLAIGFETTAPGTALMLQEARRLGLRNLSTLTAHKRMLPILRALLSSGDVPVDGFLCPGHVSVIVGFGAFEDIAREFGRPCVTAGFDAHQIARGLAEILRQLLAGQSRTASVYPAALAEGNIAAQGLLSEVFEPADAAWRAIGVVPGSGLALRGEWAAFDAARRFELPEFPSHEPPGCCCGDVILGRREPRDCPLFARRCTPRDPVGPCMISSEGACAAAFKYGTHTGLSRQ